MLKGRGSMLVPRMRSVWPLLVCVLLSTLIAASLVATFASFSASALPQAGSAELLSSGHRSIVVNGAINGTQNRTDQAVVAAPQCGGEVRQMLTRSMATSAKLPPPDPDWATISKLPGKLLEWNIEFDCA